MTEGIPNEIKEQVHIMFTEMGIYSRPIKIYYKQLQAFVLLLNMGLVKPAFYRMDISHVL